MKTSKGQFVNGHVSCSSSQETLDTTGLQGDTDSSAEWDTSNDLSEEHAASMPHWTLFPQDWTPRQSSHTKQSNASYDVSSPQPPLLGFPWSGELSESHDGSQYQLLSLDTPESDLLYRLSSFEDCAALPRAQEPCHSRSQLLPHYPEQIMRSLLQTMSTHSKAIPGRDSSATPAVPNLQQPASKHDPAKSSRKRRIAKQNRPFLCTFCADSFKTKYDWSRHEKSRHFNLDYWVCTPHGGIDICALSGQHSCAYCNMPEPSQAHLQSHNDGLCKLSGQSKFFNRRDHLVQHLRHVHGLSEMIPPLDNWKIAGPSLVSQCGFCSQIMKSWGERVDHLAEHFKQGKTREDWHGDLGLGSWRTIEGLEVQQMQKKSC